MRRYAFFAGLAAITVLSFATERAGADGEFNVIVSAKNGVSALSKSEIKRLITGNTKTWDSGAVVQLGIIPADVAETAYLADLLDTTPRELLSEIQQQVFKGELRRPVVLRSSADCLALAAENAGTICVAAASAPVPPDAKVVPVH